MSWVGAAILRWGECVCHLYVFPLWDEVEYRDAVAGMSEIPALRWLAWHACQIVFSVSPSNKKWYVSCSFPVSSMLIKFLSKFDNSSIQKSPTSKQIIASCQGINCVKVQLLMQSNTSFLTRLHDFDVFHVWSCESSQPQSYLCNPSHVYYLLTFNPSCYFIVFQHVTCNMN